jgi:hypothetical protein
VGKKTMRTHNSLDVEVWGSGIIVTLPGACLSQWMTNKGTTP